MHDDRVLESAIAIWLDDPDSDVTYAEEVEGSWAVRMAQTVRDATTVWWRVGDYTITAEAYVIPAPSGDPTEAYRFALARNHPAWKAHFAIDTEGAFVIRGRVDRSTAEFGELDQLLGEIYQMIESSFRPLIARAFGGREKTR